MCHSSFLLSPQIAVHLQLAMKVNVSEGDIRKMTIKIRPDKLRELMDYSFASPQYQNPINGVISQISLSFQQSQLLKSSLLIEHIPVTTKPELCSDISSQGHPSQTLWI